eukprot:gene16095-18174_t
MTASSAKQDTSVKEREISVKEDKPDETRAELTTGVELTTEVAVSEELSDIEANELPVKFMDSITNGLDTATAFDIVRDVRIINHSLGCTNLIPLLQ